LVVRDGTMEVANATARPLIDGAKAAE
jgi:hypothetical protein